MSNDHAHHAAHHRGAKQHHMVSPRPRHEHRWHLTSQYGARRNALLGCTALAQRRRERDDVEQFLSDVHRLQATVPVDSTDPQRIPV
jgi:hypothetical protein